MGILKKSAIAITALLFGVIIVSFVLPDEYEVERSIIIAAEPDDIYPEVVNLKAWPSWGGMVPA